MAKSKMTTCKHCGAEIAASAKVCPHCGGKNKPPIYKRWWFILIYCDCCAIRYWRLWKQFWRFEQQQSDLDENEWCVYCIVD